MSGGTRRAAARRTLAVVTVTAAVGLSSGAVAAAGTPQPTREAGGAVSVPYVRPAADRLLAAQTARWSGRATAQAVGAHDEARALAMAALRAARVAAATPAVTTGAAPADLHANLMAAEEQLQALLARTAPSHATPPAGARVDGVATRVLTTPQALDRAVETQLLRGQATAIFGLAFEAEAAAQTVADEASPHRDASALVPQVAAASAAAEQLAALPDLQPLLPAEDETEAFAGGSDRRPAIDPSSPWANGEIPLDVLCAPVSAPQQLLRCDAAAALDLLAARYLQDTGHPLALVSSYRSFEQQVEVKRLRGSLAAAPGHSHHGLGIAIDLADAGGVDQFDAPVYLWMKDHAAEFGWFHPAVMEPSGSGPHEPWHWEFGGL